MDNSAFKDSEDGELKEILKSIAATVAYGDYLLNSTHSVMDSNGNRVGGWKIETD